jgi:Family of unknown function (DUF6159)
LARRISSFYALFSQNINVSCRRTSNNAHALPCFGAFCQRKDFVTMPNIVSRFARSWQLIQASCDVLRADSALLILPAVSGLATIALAVGFVALAMSDGSLGAMLESKSLNAFGPLYAWVFCWYVVQYFVVIFFNTALVGAAIALLDGGRPTVGAALKLALNRTGAILGYAVISATVGVLLQALAERLGLIGRLIEATLGLAWTAATFLVVPVLAAEGIGPWQAIERSTALLRQTWGENLIGNAGISLVMSVISSAVGLIGVGSGMVLFQFGHLVLGAVLLFASITTLLLIVLVAAALSAIYAAAVYHYAVVGTPPADFDTDLIRDAFTRKGT